MSFCVDKIDISFLEKIFNVFDMKEILIFIGYYMNYVIELICGLVMIYDFIGKVDELCYFVDFWRMDVCIFWFISGFVEY